MITDPFMGASPPLRSVPVPEDFHLSLAEATSSSILESCSVVSLPPAAPAPLPSSSSGTSLSARVAASSLWRRMARASSKKVAPEPKLPMTESVETSVEWSDKLECESPTLTASSSSLTVSRPIPIHASRRLSIEHLGFVPSPTHENTANATGNSNKPVDVLGDVFLPAFDLNFTPSPMQHAASLPAASSKLGSPPVTSPSNFYPPIWRRTSSSSAALRAVNTNTTTTPSASSVTPPTGLYLSTTPLTRSQTPRLPRRRLTSGSLSTQSSTAAASTLNEEEHFDQQLLQHAQSLWKQKYRRTCTHQGELMKMSSGTLYRRSQKRWYILVDAHLFYFRNESDVQPSGVLFLDRNTILENLSAPLLMGGYSYSFCLTVQNACSLECRRIYEKRTYELSAGDVYQLEKWLQCLVAVIIDAGGAVQGMVEERYASDKAMEEQQQQQMRSRRSSDAIRRPPVTFQSSEMPLSQSLPLSCSLQWTEKGLAEETPSSTATASSFFKECTRLPDLVFHPSSSLENPFDAWTTECTALTLKLRQAMARFLYCRQPSLFYDAVSLLSGFIETVHAHEWIENVSHLEWKSPLMACVGQYLVKIELTPMSTEKCMTQQEWLDILESICSQLSQLYVQLQQLSSWFLLFDFVDQWVLPPLSSQFAMKKVLQLFGETAFDAKDNRFMEEYKKWCGLFEVEPMSFSESAPLFIQRTRIAHSWLQKLMHWPNLLPDISDVHFMEQFDKLFYVNEMITQPLLDASLFQIVQQIQESQDQIVCLNLCRNHLQCHLQHPLVMRLCLSVCNEQQPHWIEESCQLVLHQETLALDDASIVEQFISRENVSHSNDLIMNTVSSPSPQRTCPIKGGTLERLVEQLTLETTPDSDYVFSFLLTFRSFCTSFEFMQMLIQRYDQSLQPRDKILTENQLKLYRQRKTPIRLRVVNVIKMWMKANPSQVCGDEEVMACLCSWLDRLREEMAAAAQDLEHLLGKIKERLSRELSVLELDTFQVDFVPNMKQRPITSVLDAEPMDWVKQMTLIDWFYFSSIPPHEFLDQSWMSDDKQSAPHIRRMIDYANQFVYWIGTECVQGQTPKQRSLVLKHFIQMAVCARQLQNYNLLKAIVAALQSAAVQRLKKSWEVLGSKWKQMLEPLAQLMSDRMGCRLYRQELSQASVPCIPFLGLYLTQLVFVESGNKDTLPDYPHCIHFEKRWRIATLIGEVIHYQRVGYDLLQRREDLLYYLTVRDETLGNSGAPTGKGPYLLDETEIYEKSLQLEPRDVS